MLDMNSAARAATHAGVSAAAARLFAAFLKPLLDKRY